MTLPGFDYAARPAERLEIPLAERLAAMRGQRTWGPRHGRQSLERSGRSGKAVAPLVNR